MKFDNCPWTVVLPETFRSITYPTVKPYMYAVSDYGTIINTHTGLIKEQHKDRYGYKVCNLMRLNGNDICYKVHRLVAWEFCSGRDLNLTVNHIDCNKFNNYYENLEWTTSLENVKHAIAHGLFEKRKINRLFTDEILHYFYQTYFKILALLMMI